MAGYLCHEHFRSDPFNDEVTDKCLECIAAKKAARDRVQAENTIRPDVDYGRHIAVACRACGTTGTTKNIRPIGCRTLFVYCEHGPADMEVILP